MSGSIKLKHASGNGVIISAPSTNPSSDKTITLPSDESGTFATKDSTNNLQNISSINGGATGAKNLIINGGHNVSQRGTAAVTVTGSAAYRCVDRWKTDIDGSGGGDFSHAQSTDVPDGQGFTNSSKITIVTQASQPTSEGNRNQLYYQLEKQDVAQLCWGTSSAKTCTLSFWVKGSITGVYPLWFQYYSSGGNQYFYTNYTINAANTWEKKTITLTGPTSGGTVSGTTAVGFRIEWGLGYGSDSETGTLNTWVTSGTTTVRTAAGSVYLPENAGATWYLTGCQFEVGSVGTAFQFKSFAEELTLCQRYYYLHAKQTGSLGADSKPIMTAAQYTSTQAYGVIYFPVQMRATPTLEQVTGTDFFRGFSDGNADSFDSFSGTRLEPHMAEIRADGVSRTQTDAAFIRTNANTAELAFSAEL